MKHKNQKHIVRCQTLDVKCRQRGFTIIELMVVIGIIAILMTVVVANFPKAKLQLSLSRVAYGFAQDLRRAQMMSLSNPSYKDAGDISHPVKGYGGYVNLSDNKKYIIYADNPSGTGKYDGSDYIVSTVDFSVSEPGVFIKEFGTVGNDLSLDFTPGSPATTITPASNQNYVVFALESDPTITKSVSFYNTGLIEVWRSSILGNNVIGDYPDSDSSNLLHGDIFDNGNQHATAVSMSLYFMGAVDSPPHNKYQVAIYSDNNGIPGSLLAVSAIGTITPNSWNTIPISLALQPNTSYWLINNSNGTNINVNNLAITNNAPPGQHDWHSNQPFDAGFPQTFGVVNGSTPVLSSIYLNINI